MWNRIFYVLLLYCIQVSKKKKKKKKKKKSSYSLLMEPKQHAYKFLKRND